ncbi:hypothetical protein [Enterococcus rotai]|uniref:hypothetical protein n=1 Tax=Enterococcus rotai TaxID=118060 RepID=UPI0032B4DA81
MKRKGVLLFILVLLFSGCSKGKSETKAKPLSNEDVSLITSVKQKGALSQMNLPNLTEEEAKNTLEDKYNLEMNVFLTKAMTSVDDLVEAEGLQSKDRNYTILAEENKLTIYAVQHYDLEDHGQILLGQAEATYKYDKTSQKIHSLKQSILINCTSFESNEEKKLEVLVKKLAEAMMVTESDQVVKQFSVEIKKSADALSKKVISIYDDSKEAEKKAGVGRLINLSFDREGRLEEVYAQVTDYSN